MRRYEGREFSLQIAAGHRGLRLIRGPLVDSSNRRYALRWLQDATFVVGEVPSGELSLVKASSGRNKKASWMTLDSVERLLKDPSHSLQPPLRRSRKRPSQILNQIGAPRIRGLSSRSVEMTGTI